MKPKPWSHTRLEAFENCPRAFYEIKEARNFVEIRGEATLWGDDVHKHFEARARDGVVLPPTLEMHEGFLAYLQELPGEHTVEEKIALNARLEPCGYWDKDVWWRGGIDFLKVAAPIARVIDYKTGKHHAKFMQLKEYAIYVFRKYPEVDTVRAEYYWTQMKATGGETYTREQLWDLVLELKPALDRYAQAFETDTWIPRQSGLCKKHCAVTTCEFNGKAR